MNIARNETKFSVYASYVKFILKYLISLDVTLSGIFKNFNCQLFVAYMLYIDSVCYKLIELFYRFLRIFLSMNKANFNSSFSDWMAFFFNPYQTGWDLQSVALGIVLFWFCFLRQSLPITQASLLKLLS